MSEDKSLARELMEQVTTIPTRYESVSSGYVWLTRGGRELCPGAGEREGGEMSKKIVVEPETGNTQTVEDNRPVRVWCIGPDSTEYYAAHDEAELRKMYVEMVGEEQAAEDFAAYCVEVPQSAMDEPFDWTDEDGRRIKTTWRKQINDAYVPCQISTGYN
jgi:hypothetical protein